MKPQDSSIMKAYPHEACAPYDVRRGDGPVSIWAIVDRLTVDELRFIAMSYSVRKPVGFEGALMEIGRKRAIAQRRKNGSTEIRGGL